MTWKASLVLVALVVACGDSSNGSGGDAGSGGGTAGAGGFGGTGGFGGAGGFGGEEALYGDQLPCDDIVRGDYIREEWEYIPTTPGEVFYLTICDHYDIVDGVLQVDRIAPPGCTTRRKVADGDEFRLWCRETFHGAPMHWGDPGYEFYMEHGWERYYLRREEGAL